MATKLEVEDSVRLLNDNATRSTPDEIVGSSKHLNAIVFINKPCN